MSDDLVYGECSWSEFMYSHDDDEEQEAEHGRNCDCDYCDPPG